MPAYNAAKTIERTYQEIPLDLVDEVVVTDDASHDETVEIARRLGCAPSSTRRTGATAATRRPAIPRPSGSAPTSTVMLHPDYQYTPEAAARDDRPDHRRALRRGSRLAGPGRARPRRAACRGTSTSRTAPTAIENLLCGAKLSEYHTGYRAFSREVLESLPLLENSDDFVFDNQMLAQILLAGFEIGEVSCPAAYFEEASSINFRRSVRYGLGVLAVSLQAFLQRKGLAKFRIFDPEGRAWILDPGRPRNGRLRR